MGCFIHVDYNVTNRSSERCLRVSTNTPFVDQLLEECTIQSAMSTLGKHEAAVRWTRKCDFNPLKWAKKTNLHNQKDSVFVGVDHLIPPAVKLLYSTQIPTHLQERRVLSSDSPGKIISLPSSSDPSITELPCSAPSGVVQQQGLQESSVVPVTGIFSRWERSTC